MINLIRKLSTNQKNLSNSIVLNPPYAMLMHIKYFNISLEQCKRRNIDTVIIIIYVPTIFN